MSSKNFRSTKIALCTFTSLLSSSCPSATGSVCNVVLMRNSELRTGIEVFDEKGEVVGTSKVAAKKVSQDVLMDV